jgi:nicotinate-nucleotide pyrophosphorylase (carboxylating)
VIAQASGIIAGGSAAAELARMKGLRVRVLLRDGQGCRAGSVVLELEGDGRRILEIERIVLNLLMHLSGIATQTARAVARLRRPGGKQPKIFATRKTLPGLRDLEKWAVVAGGGFPHRRDLSDGILIKNNHLALTELEEAVRRARGQRPRGMPVQVEVHSAEEALRAAKAGADALLLDNVGPSGARQILRVLLSKGLRKGLFVEASGGITLQNVARYRDTALDSVSLGSLTHSAPALPFHLRLAPQ